MEIFKIVALGIVGTILIIIVREERPELGMLLSLVVGITLFAFALGKVITVFRLFRNLAWQARINLVFLDTIFKVIGIAYVAEFGAQICRDAGEGVIAQKIELGAKVLIIVMAFPIFMALLDALLGLLPT